MTKSPNTIYIRIIKKTGVGGKMITHLQLVWYWIRLRKPYWWSVNHLHKHCCLQVIINSFHFHQFIKKTGSCSATANKCSENAKKSINYRVSLRHEGGQFFMSMLTWREDLITTVCLQIFTIFYLMGSERLCWMCDCLYLSIYISLWINIVQSFCWCICTQVCIALCASPTNTETSCMNPQACMLAD